MIANGSQKEQYRNIEKGLLGALFGSLSFFACLAVILILLLGLHYLLFYYFKCRQVIYHVSSLRQSQVINTIFVVRRLGNVDIVRRLGKVEKL